MRKLSRPTGIIPTIGFPSYILGFLRFNPLGIKLSSINVLGINVLGVSILGFSLLAVPACGKSAEDSEASEMSKDSQEPIELPAVPAFEIPSPYPDGTHSVREVLLKSPEFTGSQTKIKGYVVWVYDCATALESTGKSAEDIKKMIDTEPERWCSRPNFRVADSPGNDDSEKTAWIVEVPRALRPDEKRSRTEENVAMAKMFKAMPEISIGDEVIVEGEWNTESPRQARKSAGLLVYKSMQNLTKAAAE